MDGCSIAINLVKGKVVGAESVNEVLEGNQRLRIGEVASNGLDLVALCAGSSKPLSNGGQSVFPRGCNEAVTLLDQGCSQPLEAQTVVRVAGLVADPLFIDVVIGLGL